MSHSDSIGEDMMMAIAITRKLYESRSLDGVLASAIFAEIRFIRRKDILHYHRLRKENGLRDFGPRDDALIT